MITDLLDTYGQDGDHWADFGCSNGFVISEMLRDAKPTFDHIVGYDRKTALLDGARARVLPRVSFESRNMDEAVPRDAQTFDIVTCFETLEHVARYRDAFAHLYAAGKPGGYLIVTVPNETGLSGLAKLIVQKAIGRDYSEFFKGKSRASYVRDLLTYAYIDGYRVPNPNGYGPHLGFDYRRLEQHVDEQYTAKGKLELVDVNTSFMKFNVALIYRYL
ncbi:MAG: methyltransferase domain-containing protein [Bacteroidota bacterium]